jgi:hypothetical protein
MRMGQLCRWDSYADGTAMRMRQLCGWDSYADETAMRMRQLCGWGSYADGIAMRMGQLYGWMFQETKNIFQANLHYKRSKRRPKARRKDYAQIDVKRWELLIGEK